MIPLLILFSCQSQPIPEETTSARTSEKNTEQKPTKNIFETRSKEAQPEEPVESPERKQIPPPKESLPTPSIEGLAKKEKEKKITAEEIDAFFNKRKKTVENQDSIDDNQPTVEVEIEPFFNAHYNDANSQLYVRVFKDTQTLGASMSHDHVILARGWEGQVIWKEGEPHNCIFEFQIPVHFLDVDPDNLRKSINLPGTISKGDKKTIRTNMLSESQLWAKKHSYINFSAQSCAILDEGVRVKGNMKIRGKKIKIKTLLQFDTTSGLTIDGSFHLNQTSFGLTPYSGFMGAVKNKDRITISLHFSQDL
jgi:hypothetical protein